MDEPLITVSLPPQDWQMILRGILELPMKDAAPTFNRLQQALAEAQKPADPPNLREVNS